MESSPAPPETPISLDPNSTTSPNRPRWREPVAVAAITVLFAVLYTALAARLNSYHSFWSPDSGVRFQAIRNWLHHGSLAYLHYDNLDVDPTARFHPLGRVQAPDFIDGYVLVLPRGIAPVFPLLFEWLSGWSYRLFGFGGLTILPVAAGVATVPATYLLARALDLRLRLLLIVVLGAGSPLLIYSVVFWDHTIHMLLSAMVGILLLRAITKADWRYGVGVGATLGVGLQFHELFGTMFVALTLASVPWIRRRGVRAIAIAMAMGFAPFLVAWSMLNRAIYGLPAGVHFEIAREISKSPMFPDLMRPHELFIQALIHTIGYAPEWGWRTIEIGVAIGALFIGSLIVGGRALRISPLAALLLVPIVLGWLSRVMWAHGLFEATPILLPALAFVGFSRLPKRDGDTDAALLFYRWIGTALLIFAAIVISNPQGVGMDWGDRYLLTVLPLLAVMAARAIEGLLVGIDLPPLRLLAGIAMAGLVGVGVFSEVKGCTTIAERMEGWGRYAPAVLAVPDEPVVADICHYGAYFVETAPKRMFLVRHPATDGPAFFAIMDRLHANEFTYVGQPEGLDAMRAAGLANRDPFIRGPSWPAPAMGVRFYRRSAYGGIAPAY